MSLPDHSAALPRLLRWPKRWQLNFDVTEILGHLGRGVDAVLLFLAGYFWYVEFEQPYDAGFWSEYGQHILIATIFLPFVFEKAGCYEPQRLAQRLYLLRTCLVGNAILFGVVLAVGFATHSLGALDRLWSILWVGTSMFAMLTSRAIMCEMIRHLEATGRLTERIAIVGAGVWSARLVEYLTQQHERPVTIVGIFDDRMTRQTARQALPMGSLDDLIALGKTQKIDRILVALPWSAENRLLEVIRKLKHLSVDIAMAPDRIGFSLMNRKMSQLGNLPLLRVADRPLASWKLVAKAVEDRVLALFFLILLSPVLLFTGLAVRLDSPGPVLFRQKRHGFNNSEIEVLKFRTMRWEATDFAGAEQTKRQDARVTRVGRILRSTSLDELPQLFNVLMGQMSIVGPRPHPVGMRTQNRLCDQIIDVYAHRHRVKPGITGWAQVNGFRGATESPEQLERRVEYDLQYIDRWSVLFDLKIIAMTPFAVLFPKDAY
jgi:Undecaprenyl-phosphate glucose phosphotransferase